MFSKLRSIQIVFIISILVLFNQCKKNDEEPSESLGEANGTLEINLVNITDAKITAGTGDLLNFSIQIKSSDGSIPQKLRIWEAKIPNTRGIQLKFSNVLSADSDGNIALRNLSDQTKTIEYILTAASGKIYLYIEVEDDNNKTTRKMIEITVSGEGAISYYKNITLGDQNNQIFSSYMSSGYGVRYDFCDIGENIRFADITFAVLRNGSDISILSSPWRKLVLSDTITNTKLDTLITPPVNSVCSGSKINVVGGRSTFYTASTGIVFNTALNTQLNSLSITRDNAQKISITTGGVYAFLTSDNKKGMIRVNSISVSDPTNRSINIDVKVQR